jgi:DNA-binding response OmpR family regulator
MHPQDRKLLVLIVEDDTDIAQSLVFRLGDSFDTVVAHTYADARRALEQRAPAVIVLDIELGDDKEAGFRLCHEIRTAHTGGPLAHLHDVMILMLTVLEDAPRGLDDGADDYICKPFKPRELVSRVKALVRRMRTNLGQPVLELAPLKIDTERQIAEVDSTSLRLTNLEYTVLYRLMLANGKTVSRSDFLGPEVESRTIDQTVSTLRQKLKVAHPGADKMLETVHGRKNADIIDGERRRGYRIVPLR